MKTFKKISVVLLPITAVMLCSYAFMHKGSTDVPNAIATSNAIETGIGTLKFKGEANMNIDTTIKTRKASCSCGQLTAIYKGPDPERRALCQCNSCKLRTGSVLSAGIRVPSDRITIKGKSTAWTFPEKGKTVAYRSCDSEGVTYHFCPVCGSTVYWDINFAPGYTGMGVGSFTDPKFPEPNISGFEEYKHPWTMNISDLPMPGGHHE